MDGGWVSPDVRRVIGAPLPPATQPTIGVSVVRRDGRFLSLPVDVAAAKQAIAPHAPRDAERWEGLLSRLRAMTGVLETLYRAAPPAPAPGSLQELGQLATVARAVRSLGRPGMIALMRWLPMSIQQLVEETIEDEALGAAIAAGGVCDLRQGPRSGGTVFSLLHRLVGAPAGSVRARAWWTAAPDAFIGVAALSAATAGVVFRTGTGVSKILVRDDAVAGVVLADGVELEAPLVVSTASPAHTLLRMVDPEWLDPELLDTLRHIKYRGCTAFVCYVCDRLPELPGLSGPEAALASVVTLTPTTDDLERAYDAAKYGAVSERPHVELTAQTLRWPSLGGGKRHAIVARVQYAPYVLRDGSWDAVRREALGVLVDSAIRAVAPRFDRVVTDRLVLSPVDVAERFSMEEGSIGQGEMTLDQILFMRPVGGLDRYATPIRGLYLGGSGSHPGPGIVGGAGLLAARTALRG
jgi:phytoene dehydrogenase-like protein